MTGGALAIYISFRLFPIHLTLKDIQNDIRRIDKDRAEEDKRIKEKVKEVKDDTDNKATKNELQELKERIRTLERNRPNCEAHMAEIKGLIDVVEEKVRTAMLANIGKLAEANAEYRDNLRTELHQQSEGWSHVGITREATEALVRTLREELVDRINKLEDKVYKR